MYRRVILGKYGMRLFYSCCGTGVAALFLLISFTASRSLPLFGVLLGILAGLLGASLLLMSLAGKARRNEFILATKHPIRFLAILFLIVVPVLAISGAFLLSVLHSYFPEVNWPSVLLAVGVVASAVFCAVYTAGVYLLEKRYDKQFYLG